MTKFSIVMAFRDTPRERKFAEKSIPSAIALGPDDLLIGVDEPADESLLALISRLCAEQSFTNYRILPVPKSDKWRLQLANVIWHCYLECRNDRILAFDVDSVLRPAVLHGLGLVGRDGNAVVSFTKRLLVRNLGDLVRYAFYRLRVMRDSYVFSGTYWIFRPHYFKDVDIDGMQTIENGIDTYMVKRISAMGRHRILTLKEMGVDCMDMQNGDYPWRQFQDGIWYYANKDTYMELRKQSRARENSIKSIIRKPLDRYLALVIILKSATCCHPWLFRGWFWARQNPDHPAIRAARGTELDEWSTTGSKHVKAIRDWYKDGRLGTGFD